MCWISGRLAQQLLLLPSLWFVFERQIIDGAGGREYSFSRSRGTFGGSDIVLEGDSSSRPLSLCYGRVGNEKGGCCIPW